MTTPSPTPSPGTRLGDPRSWLVAAAAVLAVGAVAVTGWLVPAAGVRAPQAQPPTVGRTGSVCTVHGVPAASTPGADTTVTAVAARPAAAGSGGPGPATAGSLSGRLLGPVSRSAVLSVDTLGDGAQLHRANGSVVLDAQGAMASMSAGAVLSTAEAGEDRGLALAPCAVPAVNQWLTGLGARGELRSDLVLSNSDATGATVDLRIFGRAGAVPAAGASGITIPAGGSRLVSLESLVDVDGPLAVNVRASVGRVSAMARDLRSVGEDPAGADYHPASVSPATRLVLPAVPGGPGTRVLTVVNPGQQRTTVTIDVLGPEGPFAPAGAANIDVEAQSTASIDVSAGLAGQIGTLALSSPAPVTASVTSTAQQGNAAGDLAVTTAQPAIGGLGIAPIAVARSTTSEVALSNDADQPVTATLRLLSLDGVSLSSEEIPIGARATVARRLDQPAPAYAVLTVPAGAAVYAGSTLTATGDAVAGLTGAGLVTPDLAGRAPVVQPDPGVGG